MADVQIRIKKDGTVTFEVNGCTGTVCEDITKVLTSSLGDVEETRYKEEYAQVLPDYINVGEGE